MTRTPGFTLIELVTTVAVIGCLLALTGPSFHGFMVRTRATSEANALVALILLTRSEAVLRDRRVTMCKTVDGVSCSTSAAVTWDQGILIFADGGPPNLRVDAGEPVMRREVPFSTRTVIRGNANIQNAIVYETDGRLTGVLNGTWTLVPAGDAVAIKTVVVNVMGRPRVG